MNWIEGEYQLSTDEGWSAVNGFTGHGLGLHMDWDDYDAGWYEWRVTHLQTGLLVAIIDADDEEAFEIAGEIAAAYDWEKSSSHIAEDAAACMRSMRDRHACVYLTSEDRHHQTLAALRELGEEKAAAGLR